MIVPKSLLLRALVCLIFSSIVSATTIIAARCKDGVVVCADSLSATTGALIATRQSKKVFMLTSTTIMCCVSSNGNGAIHFQRLYSNLRENIQEHKVRFDSQLSTSSIAKLARRMIATKYDEAHVVIAGYDEVKENVEYVDYVLTEILPGGARIEQEVVAAGTGSALVASLLDVSLQKANSLSAKEGLTNGTPSNRGFGQRGSNGDSNVGKDSRHTPDSSYTSSSSSGSSQLAHITVEDAAAALRQCVRQASQLDPQTGGDRYSMWVLTRPAVKDAHIC